MEFVHWRERGSVALAFILCAVEVFHRVGFSAVLKRSSCCSIKKWKEEKRQKTKKERVSNSRFESDTAGGVVQLRKLVEFDILNFCDQNT